MRGLPKLTAKQQEVLYLPASGHTVVIGSAGSGKTTMALYRASFLAATELAPAGDTVIISYNRSLVNWMASALGNEPDGPSVTTFHGWVRTVLAASGTNLRGYLANSDRMRAFIARAYADARRQRPNHPVFKRVPSFFNEELGWITGMGISSLNEYLDAQRVGRGETRLDHESRRGVWEVYSNYLTIREKAGFSHDLNDIASLVLSDEHVPTRSPYAHTVIDEGQDLKPQMLRAIAHATPTDGSLTFFGDPTQQIYGKQMSWRTAGLTIRKQWRFKDNYRNTRQIFDLARALGAQVSDSNIGDPPRAAGAVPRLFTCIDSGSEVAEAATLARSALKSGRTVAVLSRKGLLAGKVASATGVATQQLCRDTASFDPAAVYWGTVHAAKGFEFDEVIVVGLDNSSWPDSGTVARSDLEAATDQDTKLLYVAVTRARTHLTLTYTGTPTRILPVESGLYELIEC